MGERVSVAWGQGVSVDLMHIAGVGMCVAVGMDSYSLLNVISRSEMEKRMGSGSKSKTQDHGWEDLRTH